MQVIALSDYALERSAQLRSQRIQAFAVRTALHVRRLVLARKAYYKLVRHALRSLARLDLPVAWRAWVRSRGMALRVEKLKSSMPILGGPSPEEARAAFGHTAERRFDRYLDAQLGPEWTLVSGFVGPGGEIDRILIGPSGVFAFEIKGNRGVISADGDRWYARRLDRRGRTVSLNTIPKAPDHQLRRAASALERIFAKHGLYLRVVTVVLFTAHDAYISDIGEPCVHLVTTLRNLHLSRLLYDHDHGLTESQIEFLVDLIVSHHQE